MKKAFIASIIPLLFGMSSCKYFCAMDISAEWYFYNESEYPILVYFGDCKYGADASPYRFPKEEENMSLSSIPDYLRTITNIKYLSRNDGLAVLSSGEHVLRDLFASCNNKKPLWDTSCMDKMPVYVYDIDTITKYGFLYCEQHNLYLQRYDFSQKDHRTLLSQIYFPPSESMRDVEMWPPYGTYDANGHRVDTK